MAALLALLAAVGWGSSDFVAGSASRKSSAVSVVVLTHLTAVLVLLCVTVDLGPVWTMVVDLAGGAESRSAIRWSAPRVVGTPTVADIGWGVAAGLGGGVGAMLLFRGLGKGSMAVVAPVTATGAATIPVLVGLATGESVAAPGLAGIALALVAIVLVSLSADEGVTAVDAHPGDPDAATGDVGSDDAPLVIPDGWAEQFGPALVPRPALAAAVDQHSVTVRADVLPPVPVATPAMPAPAPGTLVAPAVFPTADVKVRGPLVVMMVLLVALVLAAIGIAASPLADLASGAPLDVRRGAMLGFSLLAMGTTTVAIGVTHRLFALTSPANVAPRAPRHPDRRPDVRRPVIRRVLAQPGLPEALLSGIGFGTFFVFIYRASESAGHWPLVSARMVSVVMFAVGALVARAAVLPQRESRVGVMWAGVFDAAAAVLFVLAIRAGLLSVGAVLASLYPAVTVLLARAVTKERIRPQQVAGLGLALAAVSLLAI